MTNRPVESTEDFKLRIAAMLHDKAERIAGARPPHPMLVRKRSATRTQKRRRR
jgi:hypothetical protein